MAINTITQMGVAGSTTPHFVNTTAKASYMFIYSKAGQDAPAGHNYVKRSWGSTPAPRETTESPTMVS
jgi:hypothetical protein